MSFKTDDGKSIVPGKEKVSYATETNGESSRETKEEYEARLIRKGRMLQKLDDIKRGRNIEEEVTRRIIRNIIENYHSTGGRF